jgi:hypothetical protein
MGFIVVIKPRELFFGLDLTFSNKDGDGDMTAYFE